MNILNKQDIKNLMGLTDLEKDQAKKIISFEKMKNDKFTVNKDVINKIIRGESLEEIKVGGPIKREVKRQVGEI